MKDQLTEFCNYLSEQKVIKKTVNQDDIINNFIKLHTNKKSGITDIVEAVAHVLFISPELLKQNIRKREVVEARQIAMWMLKKYTKLSLSSIGASFEFGKHRFDHSTVLYSINTVDSLRWTNADFRRKFEKVKTEVEKINHEH